MAVVMMHRTGIRFVFILFDNLTDNNLALVTSLFSKIEKSRIYPKYSER